MKIKKTDNGLYVRVSPYTAFHYEWSSRTKKEDAAIRKKMKELLKEYGADFLGAPYHPSCSKIPAQVSIRKLRLR